MTPEELKGRKKQLDKELTKCVMSAVKQFYVETGLQVSEVNVVIVEDQKGSGNTDYHVAKVETEVRL